MTVRTGKFRRRVVAKVFLATAHVKIKPAGIPVDHLDIQPYGFPPYGPDFPYVPTAHQAEGTSRSLCCVLRAVR